MNYELPWTWDAFVAAHPDGSFCHLRGHLEALRHCGYAVRTATVIDGERLRGLLAWVEVGRRRVSLPFYEYGGPLVADEDPVVWQRLLEAAGPLEIRVAGGWRGPRIAPPPRTITDFAVLDLHEDPERLEEAYDGQLRKALRRAERCAVRVYRVTAPEALLTRFHPAWLRWIRDRHGTPPLPRAYWEAVARGLPGRWHLFCAAHDGRDVAHLLGFGVGRRLTITAIASDPAEWELRAVDAVHAAAVRWACGAGFERFDFGSCRYAGQRRYKQKWGCRLVPYQVVGAVGPAPEGPLATAARRAWRHLPLPWTEALGPPVRRWLTL